MLVAVEDVSEVTEYVLLAQLVVSHEHVVV